jgi:hypothetical protein
MGRSCGLDGACWYWFAVERRNTHFRHQRADVQSTGCGMPFAPENLAQLPRPEKGVFEVQLVDGAHQRQIFL